MDVNQARTIQTIAIVAQSIGALALIVVTYVYVRITRSILNETSGYVAATENLLGSELRQENAIYNPIIVFTVESTAEYNEDQYFEGALEAVVKVTNIGNSPALSINSRFDLILNPGYEDDDYLFHFTSHNAFLLPNESCVFRVVFDAPSFKYCQEQMGNIDGVIGDFLYERGMAPVQGSCGSFGPNAITIAEEMQLDEDIMAALPGLKVFASYKNHLGQSFRSTNEFVTDSRAQGLTNAASGPVPFRLSSFIHENEVLLEKSDVQS